MNIFFIKKREPLCHLASPKYCHIMSSKRSPAEDDSKKKRRKTFVGCFTCRRRKVACDLQKPSCDKCKKAGFVCDGYKINLRWSQPIEFDKYGTQLPSVPTLETEYAQRRSIKFVEYNEKTRYNLYDEMNLDLAKLHNIDIPNLESETQIRGHFGAFRGIGNSLLPKNSKRMMSNQPASISNRNSNSASSLAQQSPSTNNMVQNATTPMSVTNGSSNFATPKSNQQVYPFSFNTNGNGNEWLSNELLDAALLTASALNGDTQWLDILDQASDLPALSPMPNQQNNHITGHHLLNQHHQQQQQQQQSNQSQNQQFATPLPKMSGPSAAQDVSAEIINDNMLHSLFQGRQQFVPQKYSNNGSSNYGQQINSLEEENTGDTIVRENSTDIEEGNEEIESASSKIVPIKNKNNKFIHSDKTIIRNDIQIHANSTTRMPKSIMEILDNHPLPKTLAIDNFGIPTTSLAIHPMARYLLNYYIEDVADMMTVIPLAKNPWKSIYFPRAIMAIGELASLGKTSNARHALLNALLAVSAFNLQSKFVRGSDEMKYYVSLGIQLRKQASFFVSKCLEEDILKQKYKDVLVAVLSMVTIDVVWGTMSGCKIHLDHCEKIIEKKMQHKKKLSSKAIILHRIFSSMKLLQDSTSLENIPSSEIFLNERNYKGFLTGKKATPEELEEVTNSNMRGLFKANNRNTNDSRANSKMNDDSPSDAGTPNPNGASGKYSEKITDNGKVRIEYVINSSNTDPPMNSDDEIPAFVDITRVSFQPSKNKLDDKVVSSDAIYGLPNSLILLFGEIVPLTRFKKYHTDNKKPIPAFFDELASQLEYKLLTWKLEWVLTVDEENDNSSCRSKESLGRNEDDINNTRKFESPRYEGIYHHVMSFYHALVIYFYRFVQNVNPIYLQERVEKVVFHLNKIQEILEQHKKTSYIIPLFWQGFIAGSEAMTLYLQNSFNKWGQDIASTGVGTYWNARQIMLEIWRRKNHNIANNDWTDVLKDWKTNIMLT